MPVKIKFTNSMFNDEFKKELNGASENYFFFFLQHNLALISGLEKLNRGVIRRQKPPKLINLIAV
jgi:hypothetical protein